MKKFGILTLTLCLVLGLTACGATTLPTPEEPTPPAVADTEDITYEVTTDPYEQDILAEDCTKLIPRRRLHGIQLRAGLEIKIPINTASQQNADAASQKNF